MHKLLLNGEENFDRIEHIPVERSEVHPDYDPETKSYDFWMIKLKWASALYDINDVIDIDNPTDALDLSSGDELMTIGFGLTTNEDGAVPPNTLQEATVKYITNTDCTKGSPYNYQTNEIFKSMICARGDNGEDTCEVRCFM